MKLITPHVFIPTGLAPLLQLVDDGGVVLEPVVGESLGHDCVQRC